MIRNDIKINTLEKIKSFLKKQKEPIFITEITRTLHIDYNSVKLDLNHLDKGLLKKIKYRKYYFIILTHLYKLN